MNQWVWYVRGSGEGGLGYLRTPLIVQRTTRRITSPTLASQTLLLRLGHHFVTGVAAGEVTREVGSFGGGGIAIVEDVELVRSRRVVDCLGRGD